MIAARLLRVISFATSVLVLACGGGTAADGETGAECFGPCAETMSPAETGSAGETMGGTGPQDSTQGTDTDPTSNDPSGLPCDVADVISRNCAMCHSDPPKFGAPMTLVNHEGWLVPAIGDPALTVAQLADMRIEDTVSPMPPTGQMAQADRDVLHAWIADGAPGDPDSDCTPTDDTGDDPVGPDALPCEPSHTIVAHTGGSDEPFHVPEAGADNLYMCFTFASPFASAVQGTAWAPITDDERVLHHWILFRTKTPQADGGAGPCNMPSDAVFVSGWAPGGQNFVMPDDVGLELGGPDDYFILQVHYHNAAHHADAFDKSGVAFCTTDTPRTHTAGVITFGTTDISIPAGAEGAQAVGNCPSSITSYLPTTLYALASFPHMHQLGRSFSTEVTRGGEQLTLVDVPQFSFDNQISYIHDPPFEILAGDSLTTTCTYDNPTGSPVGFGEKTEDEMCFNFALIYPIDILPEEYRICVL